VSPVGSVGRARVMGGSSISGALTIFVINNCFDDTKSYELLFTYETKNSNANSTTTQRKLNTNTTDRILINEGQNISMHK
jgi:hypothetical protein